MVDVGIWAPARIHVRHVFPFALKPGTGLPQIMTSHHEQNPRSGVLPLQSQNFCNSFASRFWLTRQDGVCAGSHIKHMKDEGMPPCTTAFGSFRPDFS